MLPYRRTQIGWPCLVGVTPALVVGLLLVAWDVPFGWITVATAPIAVLLFGWLTVSVDADALVARFGIGLIRKRISLADVRSYESVRNSWYYGWGIRWISGGWLYNVSGSLAVDLMLQDGRHIRIGTAEPDALCAALANVAPRAIPTAVEPAPSPAPNWMFVPPIIIGVAVTIVVGVVLWNGQRPIEAAVGTTAFVVSGGGYSARVPFAEIQDVMLVEQLPPMLRKVNGFSAGGKLRGSFDVAGLGRSEVFVDRAVPPFVVVKTSNGVLIVNGATADETRRLRDGVMKASGR